jgi:hypothetical protein
MLTGQTFRAPRSEKKFRKITFFSQNLLPKTKKCGIIMLYARARLATKTLVFIFMEEHTNESKRALSLR